MSRLCLSILILVGSACASTTDTNNSKTVSLKSDIQPLFNASCVVCHQYGASQADLNLEEGEAWSNLVNVESTQSPLLRVQPDAPDQSYLIHKLLGTHVNVGGSGARMPPSSGAAGMMSDKIKLIKHWIIQGAKNN